MAEVIKPFESSKREVEDSLFNHLGQAIDSENRDDLIDILERVINESKSLRQKLLREAHEEQKQPSEFDLLNGPGSHYIEFQADVLPE